MYRILVVICFYLTLITFSISNANAQTAVSQIKKDTREELKQQIQEAVAAKREAVKKAVKARREEFETKLQTIKDERKKVLIQRIDAKLANINTRHTARFTKVLGKLQALLDKIDTTDKKILADIKTAQNTIDAAKAAVENQAAKTYIITISAETALRSNVGITTSQLRKDLMTTHKLVVDAKQAVQSLRKNSVIIEKEATGSTDL